MIKYRITPQARNDLINVSQYTLKQWGKKQRNSYLKSIEHKFEWTADNPNLGKSRTDIGKGYYSFPEGQHVIFYLKSAPYIDIIGVLHRSMDVIKYFEK